MVLAVMFVSVPSYSAFRASPPAFIPSLPASITILPLPQSTPLPSAFTFTTGDASAVRPILKRSFVLKPSLMAVTLMLPLRMRM